MKIWSHIERIKDNWQFRRHKRACQDRTVRPVDFTRFDFNKPSPFAQEAAATELKKKKSISISKIWSNLLEKLIYKIGSAMDCLYRKYR